MKFELGDQVVVKHSNEDGKVVEILGDKLVMVQVRGVKFPAYTDQLDFPYFKQFSSKKLFEDKKPEKVFVDQVRKEKARPKYEVAPGVWLLIFPLFNKDVFADDIVEELKIFLVNQTSTGLKFRFWLNYGKSNALELQNEVLGFSDFYLVNLPFENLNDQPEICFEFSLLTPNIKKPDYFEAAYKPKPKQVYKQIEWLKKEALAFFSTKLFDEYPDKPIMGSDDFNDHPYQSLVNAGFKVKKGKQTYAGEAPPPSIIDLHIEKLTEDYRNMSAHEKILLQLREFEKWLEKANLHYMRHGWVIHGIGTGKLKEEIHEILKRRPYIKSFANHHHPWFGNGATEIFFE